MFTIEGLEQDWLAQCQYNVTGWGITFICDMFTSIGWHIKSWFEAAPVQQILNPLLYIVCSYKLLRNDVNPLHSF